MREANALKGNYCFVTEADLDRLGVGGVVTDLQMLQCLRDFGEVDVIYLQRIRYRSTPLALLVFFSQILKSFGKSYNAYFSRGLLTSLMLVAFRTLTMKERTIIHRALSVPLASQEVKFLRFGRVESFVRFCLFQFLERILYSRLDIITVAAAEYCDILMNAGVQEKRIRVLPFYVDEGFFNQPVKRTASVPFVFGYAGGFHYYHDMSPLVQAFELFSKDEKNAQLIFVGKGLYRPKMEKEVKEKRLEERVKFIGRVPYDSMPEVLAGIDCFLLLTHAPGIPIGLLEAAAAARPMITVRKKADVALNSLFEHKKAIFMVKSPSPEEIAEAMTLLYDKADLRNTLARGARKVAQKHFSRENTRGKLEELIADINSSRTSWSLRGR